MKDLLEEILEEQKTSLEKYKTHNIRSKNITKFPFYKKNEEDVTNIVNNFIKIDEIKKTEEPKSEDFSSVSENTSDLTKNNIINDSSFNLKDFAILAKEKFEKDTILRKKENETREAKRKDSAAKKKIITETYLYIFKNFLNYSLVFDEFPEIIRNFPKFLNSIPEITSSPKKITDIKDFVYKMRTVSLIQKINILAYQIGKYNFSLISDEIYDISVLNDYSPEDLAVVIYDKYSGNNFDYEALLSLYDVVEADVQGKIVFDIKPETNEKRKEVEKFEDKKEKRKNALGFGSFNLKNNKK